MHRGKYRSFRSPTPWIAASRWFGVGFVRPVIGHDVKLPVSSLDIFLLPYIPLFCSFNPKIVKKKEEPVFLAEDRKVMHEAECLGGLLKQG